MERYEHGSGAAYDVNSAVPTQSPKQTKKSDMKVQTRSKKDKRREYEERQRKIRRFTAAVLVLFMCASVLAGSRTRMRVADRELRIAKDQYINTLAWADTYEKNVSDEISRDELMAFIERSRMQKIEEYQKHYFNFNQSEIPSYVRKTSDN